MAIPPAGSPWQLRCPAMPAETRLPAPLRAAARRFFPWVPQLSGLRSGPVYLVALSTHTAISRDGDRLDAVGFYLHRALVAVASWYTRAVTVAGRRLGRPGRRTTLSFAAGAGGCTVHDPIVDCAWPRVRFASRLRIAPARGWRIVRTELRIGRTGCFRLTATGPGLDRTIPLAVPGPDYGTPGW
ncbi:MAG TPA: hypothetical protein VFA19_01965 [Gaiellaceae bacterium]|nr:hypothetical protein [Gaiellaceae bacterium]